VTAIELDRANLDRIADGHPEVRKVLEDFYEKRAQDTVEAVIKRLRETGAPGPGAGSYAIGPGAASSDE
jgi:hypothetical protein